MRAWAFAWATSCDPVSFRERLSFVLPYKNAVLTRLYGAEPLDIDEVCQEYGEYAERLAHRVCDTSVIARDALVRGENVLLEGAQGALLDLDGGTYDYVTSSVPSSTSAGAAIGTGIGPARHYEGRRRLQGVHDARRQRADADGAAGRRRQDPADLQGPRPEIGTTTGRPRRTGWFDAVASRYSAAVNSVTAVALTRLDVLDEFPAIQVCVATKSTASRSTRRRPASPPSTAPSRSSKSCPAGTRTSTEARRFEDLPKNAQSYVRRIAAAHRQAD